MTRNRHLPTDPSADPRFRAADDPLDPEEAAFLKAICNQPADDTARLVFADWLQERADATGQRIHACRAAWIRYSMEKSTGAPDPLAADRDVLRGYLYTSGTFLQLVYNYTNHVQPVSEHTLSRGFVSEVVVHVGHTDQPAGNGFANRNDLLRLVRENPLVAIRVPEVSITEMHEIGQTPKYWVHWAPHAIQDDMPRRAYPDHESVVAAVSRSLLWHLRSECAYKPLHPSPE